MYESYRNMLYLIKVVRLKIISQNLQYPNKKENYKNINPNVKRGGRGEWAGSKVGYPTTKIEFYVQLEGKMVKKWGV